QATRIVARDTAIGCEPRDAFAVDEHRVNLIRTQAPCGVFKSKVFEALAPPINGNAACFAAGPQVAALVECQRGDLAETRADFFGMSQVARVIQPAVFC